MVYAISSSASYVIVDVLCLVLTVIVSSNASRDSGSERQVRYFFLLLTANLILDVFDAIWALLVFGDPAQANNLLLNVVNGINLTTIAFAGYFWFMFTLARFESPVTNSKAFCRLAAVPAFSVIVLHIVGYLTDQNVTLHPDGTLSFGIVHSIVAFVPLLYLLAATIVAVRKYRHAETRAQRHLSFVFILFMIAPAAAGVFDMFVRNTPVAAASIIISIVLVMMSMQESRISNDALTGLNNRRRAEAYLEDRMTYASAEAPLYLFIIDMDRFKTINDTYGHLEGDRALQLMADALRKACAKEKAFAGRWGGDEFIVICASDEPLDPNRIAALIQASLADVVKQSGVEYELACSVGYAKCDSPTQDRKLLFASADDMLYRNKLAHRS